MAIPDDVLTTLEPQPLAQVDRRIRDGDLLICSGHDTFSRLISWATDSPWSHIAMAYRWPEIGRIMVFESVDRIGVRAVPLKTFISQSSSGKKPYPGKIVLARHADVGDRMGAFGSHAAKAMADKAVDHLGNRFAPGEIAKIGLRIMLGAANVKLPGRLAPKNEFICSEYVARCLQALGIQIPWDGRGFIAPGDFAASPKVRALAQIQTL